MISVILSGGAGSRLWPLSRELHPKPFLTLPSGASLISEAYFRAAGLPQTQEICTVTNRELYFKAVEAFNKTKISLPTSFILEPFGRNTAPAIAVAALQASNYYDKNTILLVLAADHLISDMKAFNEAVKKAVDLAEQDKLVTFGLKPTRPETGYGYIEIINGLFSRFVEKPDKKNALLFYNSENFFWNAGIFCFKIGVVLDEFELWAPEILETSKDSLIPITCMDKENKVIELSAEKFNKVQNLSFDYAVLEKTNNVAVVPCDIGWNDIGSWAEFSELNPVDDKGNHISGGSPILLEEVQNCDIHSENCLVVGLGLKNLLIVDTPDALLVADKSKTQEVKTIYNRLKAEDQETYRQHRTVYRPWGSYTLLGEGPRFKIKRLEIKPGEAISLQRHHHRCEHWVVVSGMAEVTCDDRIFFLDTNESTYIKAGRSHRVANKGIIDLVIIEVQSGDYLGEDDIIRLDDNYGRSIN